VNIYDELTAQQLCRGCEGECLGINRQAPSAQAKAFRHHVVAVVMIESQRVTNLMGDH